MRRKVEFYAIYYEFLPLFSKTKSENEERIRVILKDSFKKDKQYNIKQKEDDDKIRVIIEILENEENYLFGIMGKLDDLKPGILKKLRDYELKEISDENDSMPKVYIENYTYFYLNYESLCCAVLYNSSAAKFRYNFEKFLEANVDSLHVEKIGMKNVYDENISDKLNTFKEVVKMEMIFSSFGNFNSRLLNISDSFNMSQNSLLKANISINLKPTAIKANTKERLLESDFMNSEFDKFEITGNSETDEPLVLELVERLLTKQVEIDLEDTDLSKANLNKIKNALKDSFLNRFV